MGEKVDVLVVGAGHAGCATALSLRQRKFMGSIVVLGEEIDPPYERPPLTKDYLAGERGFDRILQRPPAFWSERVIDLRLGSQVVAVSPEAHAVHLANGDEVRYRHLVWAAGSRARRLGCEGETLAGVHTLRQRDDVDRLRQELPAVQRICIVGAGYIGLEAAAVFSKMGKSVTVLEAQDQVLARVAGRAIGRFFAAEHRLHGVDLRLSAKVDRLEGLSGRVTGVRLQDGDVVRCDLVVVGIGGVPVVEPLLASGAQGRDGVEVDALCRTSLVDIYAVGDCARHANLFAGGREMRLESVQNAGDMAATVAKALVGQPEPYEAPPWFWSNQYDLRLQTVGLSIGYDQEVIRGDPESRSFSVIYLKEGRVLALDCINAVKDYVQGKALVLSRAVVDPGLLAQAERPLKTFVPVD